MLLSELTWGAPGAVAPSSCPEEWYPGRLTFQILVWVGSFARNESKFYFWRPSSKVVQRITVVVAACWTQLMLLALWMFRGPSLESSPSPLCIYAHSAPCVKIFSQSESSNLGTIVCGNRMTGGKLLPKPYGNKVCQANSWESICARTKSVPYSNALQWFPNSHTDVFMWFIFWTCRKQMYIYLWQLTKTLQLMGSKRAHF